MSCFRLEREVEDGEESWEEEEGEVDRSAGEAKGDDEVAAL